MVLIFTTKWIDFELIHCYVPLERVWVIESVNALKILQPNISEAEVAL